MKRVSVIMPAYNAALFIEMAIDSILSQSFKDWELIVVDDGSSDSTPKILEKYKASNIRIIRQENSGEACARNVGLENADGEYIAFLDADDFYYPNALDDFVTFLDDHQEYDVVYSDGEICDSLGKPMMRLSDIRPSLNSGKMLESLVLSSYMVTCCMMTRFSKIQQYSIRFDQNLAIGPDWDFWIQLALYVQFGYLHNITGGYRIHNTNITRTVDLDKRKKDRIFGRLKVMNSNWFNELSFTTRQLFFLDLLTGALSGDVEKQRQVLKNEKFLALPASVRSFLWRSVGIDILQNDKNIEFARPCFQESLNLQPSSLKTRFLLWGTSMGRPFVLAFIKIWRLLLQIRKRFASPRHSPSMRLQKLLGIQ